MKYFVLIKGEEADPTVCAANKLAKELGLIAAFGKMVNLKINGKDRGYYYLVERVSSKEYLKREFSISKFVKLSNVADWSRKEKVFGSVHGSDFDLYPGHLEKDKNPLHPYAVGVYKEMSHIVLGDDSKK